MIISVRLPRFLTSHRYLATAIVLSLSTATSTVAFGQNQFAPPISQATSSQAAGDFSAAANPDAAAEQAQQALLKCRQALAHGDVETATQMLKVANRFQIDFSSIGDAPETIQAMIDHQNELAQLAAAKDRSYNAGAASFLLNQAESLIHYHDFDTAGMLIEQAKRFPVEFNAEIGNPDQLSALLATTREQAKQAVAAQATVSAGKSQVMKLLSQAQLAMDQERWQQAQVYVTQAKQIGVSENEFAADEIRPWQLELKINNALTREANNASVAQAGFENEWADNAAQENHPAAVVQAAYDPGNDATRNVQVAGTVDIDSSIDAQPAYGEQAIDELPKATLASQETAIDLDQLSDEQLAAFRNLQSEVFKERRAAELMLESNPREAIQKMAMVRGRIANSELNGQSQRPLLSIIDRDINEMQKYIEQNLPDILNDEQNAERRDEVDRRNQRRVDVEMQLQSLIERFNKLQDEQRYAEAGVIVQQAEDLAPDSEIVSLLREKYRVSSNVARAEFLKEQRAEGFLNAMHNTDAAAIAMDERQPVVINDLEEYSRRAKQREEARLARQFDSDAERKIWYTLKEQKVQGEYRGTLAEAVDQLSRQAGVNIVFDRMALSVVGIKEDQQVNIPIHSPISLESALDVVLDSAGLKYVVENEVIKVTTPDAQSSNLVTKTYYIGDLVMPMNQNPDPLKLNFQQPNMYNTAGPRGSFNAMGSNSLQGGNNQLAMAQQMGNMPGNPFGGGMNYGSSDGPQMGVPTYASVGGQRFGGVSQADFQPLIQLIQNTIHNESWLDLGQGLGTIQAYVPNLSLIVSNTQEIQDEIQDLLKKLRELNDVQIVIEVRFITLNDQFFERVGVDFDFNINDNTGLSPDQALLDTVPQSAVVGRLPVDPFTPSADLDLPFQQGSFSAAIPQFGGFDQATAASFGFAILSDIEVFFLIQAAKGDQRSNIMQAPTVTMFNGQSASISDGASRPFVTSVVPVVGDFAVAHQPVITILPDGTNLDVQAVVSDDRRFVRLNLVPFFSQVTDVQTFTFNGSQTTEQTTGSVLDDLLDAVDGNADPGDEEIQTTNSGITIQLPVLSFTTVNTVVSVPDGGTVLMGGIKRMSEGRTERGIPFLSNIPYVNRLFKNVAIGHQTSNLMMMVTPRIIIQKEIEEDQVGITGG